jgi:cleavage and polyadenylation specificity factor subunit 3
MYYISSVCVIALFPLPSFYAQVGRSCVILRYQGKTVMLDCGIHPGFSGDASLPFFDAVDLSQVDAMLVTHFHLDHCAAVPYVVGRTNFKGRVFMTHPTKAIVGTLLKDFIKVSKSAGGEAHGTLSIFRSVTF